MKNSQQTRVQPAQNADKITVTSPDRSLKLKSGADSAPKLPDAWEQQSPRSDQPATPTEVRHPNVDFSTNPKQLYVESGSGHRKATSPAPAPKSVEQRGKASSVPEQPAKRLVRIVHEPNGAGKVLHYNDGSTVHEPADQSELENCKRQKRESLRISQLGESLGPQRELMRPSIHQRKRYRIIKVRHNQEVLIYSRDFEGGNQVFKNVNAVVDNVDPMRPSRYHQAEVDSRKRAISSAHRKKDVYPHSTREFNS